MELNASLSLAKSFLIAQASVDNNQCDFSLRVTRKVSCMLRRAALATSAERIPQNNTHDGSRFGLRGQMAFPSNALLLGIRKEGISEDECQRDLYF
jgi:hypothetical protein